MKHMEQRYNDIILSDLFYVTSINILALHSIDVCIIHPNSELVQNQYCNIGYKRSHNVCSGSLHHPQFVIAISVYTHILYLMVC